MTETTTESEVQEALDALPLGSADELIAFLVKFAQNGRTFQDFTNLTPESMEAIYLIAYNQYAAGKFAEAEKTFQFLSILNHFDERFWKGLGASQQEQGKHEEALRAFSMLSLYDLHNPLPPFLAARPLLGLGRIGEAESALNACIFSAGEKPEHAEIKQQAEQLLELVKQAPQPQNN